MNIQSELRKSVAVDTVLVGYSLPAHDEVFDLAEQISDKVSELHTYVTSVRSLDQADDAVKELLDALKSVVNVGDMIVVEGSSEWAEQRR